MFRILTHYPAATWLSVWICSCTGVPNSLGSTVRLYFFSLSMCKNHIIYLTVVYLKHIKSHATWSGVRVSFLLLLVFILFFFNSISSVNPAIDVNKRRPQYIHSGLWRTIHKHQTFVSDVIHSVRMFKEDVDMFKAELHSYLYIWH